MKVLMIGSIGVLAETSELQRQAYNQAFLEHGLDWYWNVANYCEMLKSPGGLSRLSNFSNGKVSSDLINSIHEKKEFFYGKYLEHGIAPRDGVLACLEYCRLEGIRLGFITTTSHRNVDNLSKALAGHIDFNHFEIKTTKDDVTKAKPDSEIYSFALNKFGIEPHDAIAIEDTEVNQEAALQEQILCYLFAGEYAVTQHNLNAINSLNVAVKPL